MNKVLIFGKNSYIGNSFAEYVKNDSDFEIDIIDSLNENWKETDFSKYNAIFHVAGIAHQKETKDNMQQYYLINRDLAVEVAKMAKDAGVKQFVFMSSMSVYGLVQSKKLIDEQTKELPKTNYGKSKLQAEEKLKCLVSDDFCVSILRPPMVYGKDCPGNYTKLIKAVKKFKIFPKVKNQRSSITINCLCEFVKKIILQPKSAIFIPQNQDYLCTYQVVKNEMDEANIKVCYTKIFNIFIKLLIGKIGVISKAFGNLCYDKNFIEKQIRGQNE